MFGTAQMFVHDGFVHRRFAVGLVVDFPYLQKVAAAHQVLLLSGGVPRDLKNCTNHLWSEVFHAVDQPSQIFGSVISLPKRNCTIDGEVGVATCKGICPGRIDMENKVMRKQIHECNIL
jgi:hypothetical protein